LRRRLMYRLSDGEVVGRWATNFAYPFRSWYSAINAADHLRAASLHDGTPPDPRLREAVELIRQRRAEDGRWHQEFIPPGKVWFEVDSPSGEPSTWLTLIALRVLRWWDAEAPA